MAEAALPSATPAPRSHASRVFVATIAWRNLWRNKRRTWLMISGIAFAGLLVIMINSLQQGAFDMMIDNTARFFTGHVQVQHPGFLDEPRMDRTIGDAAKRLGELDSRSVFTAVAPRAQAFALVAATGNSAPADDEADPPATGALVIGVDPDREFAALRHANETGQYLAGQGEAYLGSVLARNLRTEVGDEVAILGNAADGGVAAFVVTVAGTFNTGQAEVDRSQLHVHLADFQDAFGLPDQLHSIALTLADATTAGAEAAMLADAESVGVPWQELLPEVRQMVDLKYQSSYMIYALLLVLVTFGIVNAFIMTAFERTPEFGMLKALGMRPGAIVGMMSLEALWMAMIGIALTLAIVGTLIALLGVTGVSFGEAYSEMVGDFMIPDRMYPRFGTRTALEFSIVVLLATQIAVLIPSIRLRRLKVVDALRAQE